MRKEINDNDRAEMARLIAEGNTSGIIDREDEEGGTVRISWNLDANIFEI